MKRVTVTQLAFHNGTRVRPGAVLTVADTFKASWAEDVPVVQAEPAAEPEQEKIVEEVQEKPARKSRDKAPDFSSDLI
jgi:hypothetical protein